VNLTTVVIKGSAIWDIAPCSSLEVNRRFGGTCPLHLGGRRTKQATNQREKNRWQADHIPEDTSLYEYSLFSSLSERILLHEI
jgi:hypothetical protein